MTFKILFFYLDILTDLENVYNTRNNNDLQWAFYSMSFFIIFQFLIGAVGLLAYLRYEHKASIIVLVIASMFSPTLILAFDILISVYRATERCLNRKLVIFMVQYEVVRLLTEVLFEAIPQSIIQSIITYMCSSGGPCLSNEEQGFLSFLGLSPMQMLYISLGISLIKIVSTLYTSYADKKAMGLTWKGYFKHLMTMGAGLPLSAMKNNKVVDLDYSLRDLTGAEVHELATVQQGEQVAEDVQAELARHEGRA